MTARAAFKQADIERAIRAAKAAGEPVARVVFNDNGFEVVLGEHEARPRARVNQADRLYGPQA